MSLLSRAIKKAGNAVGGAAKAVAKPVEQAARFIATPVVLPVVAAGKLVTAGLAKTGAAPLRKLDRAVGAELGREVRVAAIHAGAGATVGAVIAGKPQLGAAATAIAGQVADKVGGLVDSPPTKPAAGPTAAAVPAAVAPLTFGGWLRSLFD